MRAAHEVGAELQPANQRIALAIFQLACLGQTMQAGAEMVTFAPGADPREKTDPGNHGRIGQAFHHTVHQAVDIFPAMKESGAAAGPSADAAATFRA